MSLHPLLLCLVALAGLRYLLHTDWYRQAEAQLHPRPKQWLTTAIGAALVLLFVGGVAGLVYSILGPGAPN